VPNGSLSLAAGSLLSGDTERMKLTGACRFSRLVREAACELLTFGAYTVPAGGYDYEELNALLGAESQ
jgi:hypothetical protein